MGVVYLVENRSFYEPFVLKTYQSSGLGDKKPRFRKEAETWVHLGSHPNIVRCLWVNEIEDALYVAAEYVAPDEDGFNTLEGRLQAGRSRSIDNFGGARSFVSLCGTPTARGSYRTAISNRRI